MFISSLAEARELNPIFFLNENIYFFNYSTCLCVFNCANNYAE